MDINSLDRFLIAQEHMYQTALEEMKNGYKCSHWMWYISPQLRGLGNSEMSYVFGINGAKEAKAYLKHPVLYSRLVEISQALLIHKGKDIYAIMGDIDAVKLKSSMTLFAVFSEEGSVFHRVLDAFYEGERDKTTVNAVL